MSNFKFKHFTLRQGFSALKFGTDAMVLGAFANQILPSSGSILDVGTGTGAIALMVAQNYPCRFITGVEIDALSTLEACYNFSQAEFSAQLNVHHGDFFDLIANNAFDAVISNPPYYKNSLLGTKDRVNVAKHSHTFSFPHFLKHAYELTNSEGTLMYIFPSEDLAFHQQEVHASGWFIRQVIDIRSKGEQSVRSILVASKVQTLVEQRNFTIRNQDNSYTVDYIDLTVDYHNKAL